MPSKSPVLEPGWPLAVWMSESRVYMTRMYRSEKRPHPCLTPLDGLKGVPLCPLTLAWRMDVIMKE
jgi:hypothetical protein